MCHPRYEWPIEKIHSALISARVGVRKRAWGYPNLDPNDGIKAYDICQIYEGQVSPSMRVPFFVMQELIRYGLAIGSIPIHTNCRPRMYQAWSAVLLSPHLLHRGGPRHFQHYTPTMHSDHNLVDDCDDCDECGPMRIPYFCALDPSCRKLLEILHLRVSFLERLCNI